MSIDLSHLEVIERLEALKRHPAYDRFRKATPDLLPNKQLNAFESALTHFLSGRPEASQELGYGRGYGNAYSAYDRLAEQAQQAHRALQNETVVNKGVRELKSTSHADLDELVSGFEQAQAELTSFLRGESEYGPRVPASLTKKFEELEAAVNQAHGSMNGWFSRLRVDGFKKAAEESLQEAKFWEEGSKGRRTVGFAKSAVAAGGAVAVGHALVAGRNKDGEERSMLARIGEATLGAGAIAGALAFGKVR